jgi:alpha-N-acetylgalactosaminidase
LLLFPFGVQIRVSYLQHNGIEIWARPITPVYQNYFSYAVAFLNRRTDGTPSDVAVTLRELGLSNPGGYSVDVRYHRVEYL